MLLNPDLSLLNRNNLFVDSTKSLAEWDNGFGRLLSWSSYFVGVPTAVLTNSAQVDLLAQHVGDDTPTLVLFLPRCLELQARYLATTQPKVEWLMSGDLHDMGDCLVWQRGPYNLTVPSWTVRDEVRLAKSNPLAEILNIGGTRGGFLATVFVTPHETSMQLVSADYLLQEFAHSERDARSQFDCGPLYTEEQLAEARHNGPRYFQSRLDWEGRVRLELGFQTYPD